MRGKPASANEPIESGQESRGGAVLDALQMYCLCGEAYEDGHVMLRGLLSTGPARGQVHRARIVNPGGRERG